jgi:ion channel
MSTHKSRLQEGLHRLSVAHLLIALVVMFVALPFLQALQFGRLVEAVIFTVVMLAAVNAVGGRRHTLIGASILVAPALVTRWVDHFVPGLLPIAPSIISAIVFVVFVAWHLLRFVMTAPTVTPEVLYAAISIYLLIAVAWAFLYQLVATFDPAAFAFTLPAEAGDQMVGFTAVYFSAQTLTTIAFGDIVPVTNVARMLALFEAATGMFYMTMLVARLVAVYSAQSRESNHK